MRCLVAMLWLAAAVPAVAEELPVWRDGSVSIAGDAGMIFMAPHNGFDRKFGLQMQVLTLKADPLLLKALIAGQLDSYEGGPGSPMVAASKGAALRVIGCHWPKQNFSLWGHGGVKTVADLRGKVIGVSAPGSAPDNFVHAALEAGKIPLSRGAVRVEREFAGYGSLDGGGGDRCGRRRQ